MKPKKNTAVTVLLSVFLLCFFYRPLYGETMGSAWGFRIDPPEDYEYADGDGKNTFSFAGPDGAMFDLSVSRGKFRTMKDLVNDINLRIKNKGDVSFFEYHDKLAALIELNFSVNGNAAGRGTATGIPPAALSMAGWALCVELAPPEDAGAGETPPLLLALAYGPAARRDLQLLHISCLDSIAPSAAEQHCPGPITESVIPRGKLKKTPLAGLGIEALIAEHDAEAAQYLVDREFAILKRYEVSPLWKEAWMRFYRTIYRDSWDRLADAAFQLERRWNIPETENRALGEKALAWVQGFKYERDRIGSDFVNLVSAAAEGRGDCDSRSMLWAIVLAQADIPAAMMVSKEYSHAMGLADLSGTGARFEAEGKKWVVAETTAKVALGLIGKEVSDIEGWIGVIFE
ncbi:MAG: hypothetical protein LBN21_02255 [Treponema sp.]|jgi:hypothetical protein|nr:hypothetical protein [Treponema sp.]